MECAAAAWQWERCHGLSKNAGDVWYYARGVMDARLKAPVSICDDGSADRTHWEKIVNNSATSAGPLDVAFMSSGDSDGAPGPGSDDREEWGAGERNTTHRNATMVQPAEQQAELLRKNVWDPGLSRGRAQRARKRTEMSLVLL